MHQFLYATRGRHTAVKESRFLVDSFQDRLVLELILFNVDNYDQVKSVLEGLTPYQYVVSLTQAKHVSRLKIYP